MRQIHETRKQTHIAQIVEALVMIQILCARESNFERIHELAEQAIEILMSRH